MRILKNFLVCNLSMNAHYANCYLCNILVYLFKKQFAKTSAVAASFYRKHMAIVRGGVVLCQRCNAEFDGGNSNRR
ncbi:hypothetical protein [Epiphyas postvittana nucleopolyhedrovirus]|uniref:Uncharacterized protein n=1 Tax=Epiphyas postvittana nucleopolyhedrovirus TaxID=70600 RepID=Q91GL1_NPVEP|nr:hypothetical protein [Epiphyas postvittana nucleopolyhedrovirus]AAK85604.1 unknown [Epiphyas postvittana nucleopolyhedrovirus]